LRNQPRRIRLRRPTRVALGTLGLSLVGSAMIGITIILVGDFEETEMRVLATTATLSGFSILSLPSLFHLERARYKYLVRMGISASLALFAVALFVIWGGSLMGGERVLKTLASVAIVAFATNHILLILIATPSRILISLCQWSTTLIITMVSVVILVAVWTEEMPETMVRPFSSLIVLDALGTITVPIMVRISRSS